MSSQFVPARRLNHSGEGLTFWDGPVPAMTPRKFRPLRELLWERRYSAQHFQDLCALTGSKPRHMVKALPHLGWKPPDHRIQCGWWDPPPPLVEVQQVIDFISNYEAGDFRHNSVVGNSASIAFLCPGSSSPR